MNKNKKLSMESKSTSGVVNTNHVTSKFKIGEIITERMHLGEFHITQFYFKN